MWSSFECSNLFHELTLTCVYVVSTRVDLLKTQLIDYFYICLLIVKMNDKLLALTKGGGNFFFFLEMIYASVLSFKGLHNYVMSVASLYNLKLRRSIFNWQYAAT